MGQLLWKPSSVVPQKSKPRAPAILDTYPQKLKTEAQTYAGTPMFIAMLIIHNSQKVEATQVSISNIKR